MTHGEPDSLVAILRMRSLRTPDRVAFTFLAEGEREIARLTYAELDTRSRAIASQLQRRHAPGERALLLYPPGLEFVAAFFGCLYAGIVAVPAYPPRQGPSSRGLERCRGIARDAEVAVVLGSEAIVEAEVLRTRGLPEFENAHWLATESVPLRDAAHWREMAVKPVALAFLQYTSGSTAAPKGVMVSHGNLIHNLGALAYCAENDAESVSVSWLPVYHDMGLITSVLLPVYEGYPSYLMAPAAFLQRPLRWPEAISRYRGTFSGGPNFAYDLCVSKSVPAERRGLDLSSWRVANNAAEPIRRDTLERFHECFRECGFQWRSFYPAYGLAEATILVSSGRRSYEPRSLTLDAGRLGCDVVVRRRSPDGGTVTVTACGPVAPGMRVVIAHPDTCASCTPGEVGEIWVGGPSVARGYWNRSEETVHTFQAFLTDTGEGPFLRTGDLGFLDQGELVVTGRIKDLIIVRGRKHYPQDIERSVAECHEAIPQGSVAAFALEGEGGEQVAIVAEVERHRWRSGEVHAAVVAAIRQAIAERHEVEVSLVALVRPGSIPKTSSGKLQRHACRAAVREQQLKTVALWAAEEPDPVECGCARAAP